MRNFFPSYDHKPFPHLTIAPEGWGSFFYQTFLVFLSTLTLSRHHPWLVWQYNVTCCMAIDLVGICFYGRLTAVFRYLTIQLFAENVERR